jgi:hypothetical protein
MDTEKVHSIKHCHVDVTNYANPINCCCDGPEGAHKKNVHEQGLKTNQGAAAAKTMMTHSLNKEASQLLCDAMRCRVEDGDAEAEDWTDSKGNSLRPDRFWNDGLETLIAADGEGDCMGIELNIWERAKVRIPFSFRMYIMIIIFIIRIMRLPYRYVDTSCTHWLAAEDSMGDSMPLITGKSGMVTPGNWATILYWLFCLISSPGFCMSFMHFDLKD